MSFQKPTHQYDVSLAASSTKRVFELSLTCIIRIIDMTQSKVFTNRYFGNSWSVDFQNSFGIGFYLAQFLLYFAQIKTKQFSNSEFSVVYLPLSLLKMNYVFMLTADTFKLNTMKFQEFGYSFLFSWFFAEEV